MTEVGDNNTIEPVNEKESAKECGREEAKKEITLSKALEMADKIKMFCLRNGIPDSHPKVPRIRHSRLNNKFYHQKPPQSSIVSYFKHYGHFFWSKLAQYFHICKHSDACTVGPTPR